MSIEIEATGWAVVLERSEAHDLTPFPNEMAPSLRSLGYTLRTALADLVDNSIAAASNQIDISFVWQSTRSCISITDNGHGMSEERLWEAMRLGKDPTQLRETTDLGRFGLGLKTASWSQCRCFTVRTKTQFGSTATSRWDYDHILSTNKWEALSDPRSGSEHLLSPLDRYSAGTIILWEDLDALANAGDLSAADAFWAAAEIVERHLSMTFHRFLERRVLKITMNGRPIKQWDPLLSGNPRRYSTIKEYIPDGMGHTLIFEGHILPSKKDMRDLEYEEAGGPFGWMASQGFYLYRQDRLILGGGWLGLQKGTREWKPEAAFKAIRISLDITNAADLDWGLDLMKSTARPPETYRPRILLLADHLRRMGRTMSTAEGKSQSHEVIEDGLWRRKDTGAATRFTINRQHILVRDALAQAKEGASSVRKLLDFIDRTAPMRPITVGVTKETAELSPEDQAQIQLARTIYYSLTKGGGVSDAEALRRLLEMPQFASRPDLAEAGITQARTGEI
ncbi:ATP-binding protein [Rhizobium leguminosarum]|uniref:ATP-binding protein n=1 Tax=Rhizobium leguminosarum TaxID=384 RepID=UPI0036DDA336